MKILLLTQWFEPEPCFKGLAFAKALRAEGHEVSVLSGYPNYPSGRIYPGYRQRWRAHEMLDGVSVTRVPLYPSHDGSAVRRILNYVSFALSSLIGIFTLPKPDIVYVYAPPPSAALGAVALNLVRRVPFVLDVQDLWPDALHATGMVRAPALIAVIRWWVALVHRKAARIVVLSEGLRRTLMERGEAADHVIAILNWTHEDHPVVRPVPAAEEATFFDIVFAGNMGPAQGLDAILDAAAVLRISAPDVRFILIGGGVDATALAERSRTAGLNNVVFRDRVPPRETAPLFAAADALLVHLLDEPAFETTIPSKTQAYLRAGRPILLGVRGDAAKLVEAANAGFIFAPGNATALVEAVLRLMAMSAEQRAVMGQAGAAYYEQNLSLTAGTRKFLRVFDEAVAATRLRPPARRPQRITLRKPPSSSP